MQKLRMDLDDLAVDSFAPTPEPGGTQAVQSQFYYTVFVYYETEYPASCGGTCYTCGGTDCWV